MFPPVAGQVHSTEYRCNTFSVRVFSKKKPQLLCRGLCGGFPLDVGHVMYSNPCLSSRRLEPRFSGTQISSCTTPFNFLFLLQCFFPCSIFFYTNQHPRNSFRCKINFTTIVPYQPVIRIGGASYVLFL